MQRIDFMGTPGIGKTFLIDRILDQSLTDLRLLSRRDALIQIARKNVAEYALLYHIVIKIGLFLPLGDAALLLANMVNRKKEEEIFLSLSTIDEIIDQALLQYREYPQPALRKIKRVQGLYQQIMDGVLINLDPAKEVVLMDESLAQHLPDVALDFKENDPLLPHLLVHVTGSVEDLVTHIRDRERQRNKSPRKLDSDYLKQSLDYYTERADRFSALGVPVVKIDISHPVTQNINEILSAIKTLPFSHKESITIEK